MNEVTMNGRQSLVAYWALRIALGVVPIVAGLDKFTNLLTDWPRYLSPLAAGMLPISPEAFMRVAGVVEIAVGALILFGFARVFAWVATVWLALIALELLTTGRFFDVAARDAVMATAAFALARLAEVAERSPARQREPTAARPASARA